MAAVQAGDVATHNRLVAGAARRLARCDAVTLAQFSVAPALEAVQGVVDVAVLSAPAEAVGALRTHVAEHARMVR